MRCPYCGVDLFPREFSSSDEVFYAVFDNCFDVNNVLTYETVNDAIEGFRQMDILLRLDGRVDA